MDLRQRGGGMVGGEGAGQGGENVLDMGLGILSDDDIKARNANKRSKVQWTTDTDEYYTIGYLLVSVQ